MYATLYGMHNQVIRHQTTEESRGFGFVTYAHPSFAAMAMTHMNGATVMGPAFQGYTIRVMPSKAGRKGHGPPYHREGGRSRGWGGGGTGVRVTAAGADAAALAAPRHEEPEQEQNEQQQETHQQPELQQESQL